MNMTLWVLQVRLPSMVQRDCVCTFWISSGVSVEMLRICCASCRPIPVMLEAAADCWPERLLACAAAWLAVRENAKQHALFYKPTSYTELQCNFLINMVTSRIIPAYSCRKARANARPTTCAPITMIWARYLACKEDEEWEYIIKRWWQS